jgi:hypothetical protein
MNPGFALPYDICVNRVWVRKHLTEGRGSAPEWELRLDPFQNEVVSGPGEIPSAAEAGAKCG